MCTLYCTLYSFDWVGGYTVGPRELTALLRQRSRPYLFSNALPPPVVACASKVSVGHCDSILDTMYHRCSCLTFAGTVNGQCTQNVINNIHL